MSRFALRLCSGVLAALLVGGLLPMTVLAAAPAAVANTASTNEDTAKLITLVGTDADGGDLTFSILVDPLFGTLGTIAAPACDGLAPSTCTADVTYTPVGDYHGADAFTFLVTDGVDSGSAVIAVTVVSQNDAPIATNELNRPVTEDTNATINVLANDDDVDGDGLTVSDVTQGTKGTVTITNGGDDLTYDPDLDATGPDTFTYTASDGHGGEDQATVTVVIANVNDDPVAIADPTNSVDEDTNTTLDPLANDTDPDPGDSHTISEVTQGTKGSVSIITSSTRVLYNPDPNATGVDTFTYTNSDGHGGTAVGTITVQITSVNDNPTAVADPVNAVTEDITKALTVMANDSDPDGDATTIIETTDGAKGNVSISGGGTSVTYDPDPNANGNDAFTYTLSDGRGGTAVGTVSIQIAAVNDDPTAVNDSTGLDEDAGPTFINVLANDGDADGDALTISGHGPSSHGTVTQIGPSLFYEPGDDYDGPDSFSYTVSDGHGGADTATVTITVTPVNDPPAAIDDTATMTEDPGPRIIAVLGNDDDIDGDAITVTAKTDPLHGTLTLAAGLLTYTPAENYFGADGFTYTISDGEFTDSGIVTINVTSDNDPPDAVDDAVTITRDTAANPVDILTNDSDVELDPLLITGKSNGSKGTVVITGGGTGLTYDPFTGYLGADTFTYTISDGNGGTDTATVSVNITGLNRAPNAVNDVTFSVPEGAAATELAVGANDDDPDGDTFTVVARTNGAHGITRITAGGDAVTYDPNALFYGTDSFTYTIRDAGGLLDTATVVVTVARDRTAPIVVAPAQRFLGQTVGTSTIKVRMTWSGSDVGSGIKSYLLQESRNGGTYTNVALITPTRYYADRTLTNNASYRYRVRATDREGNVSGWRYSQTFKPAVFQESSGLATYTGAWLTYKTTGALGGAVKYTPTLGKKVVFGYTVYDVALVMTKTASSGSADIYIDGVLSTRINLKASKTTYRQLVYTKHFTTLGAHTIEIRPIGTGRVDIDGFAVLR